MPGPVHSSGGGGGGGGLPAGGVAGQVIRMDGVAGWVDDVRQISLNIDGGGAVITTGVRADVQVPWNCEILDWTLLADLQGSVVIDVWKDTYANFPPVVADTMVGGGGTKPTLTNQLKNQDLVVAGWVTKVINELETLRFNVDSAATVTRLHLGIRVKLT